MYLDPNITKMCIKIYLQSVKKFSTIAVKCYQFITNISISVWGECFISVLLGVAVFPVGGQRGHAWDNALFLISYTNVGEWQQIYHPKLFPPNSWFFFNWNTRKLAFIKCFIEIIWIYST